MKVEEALSPSLYCSTLACLFFLAVTLYLANNIMEEDLLGLVVLEGSVVGMEGMEEQSSSLQATAQREDRSAVAIWHSPLSYFTCLLPTAT